MNRFTKITNLTLLSDGIHTEEVIINVDTIVSIKKTRHDYFCDYIIGFNNGNFNISGADANKIFQIIGVSL